MTVDDRLALNTKTTNNWSLDEIVAGCRRAGIAHIGLWRELYDGVDGARAAGELLRRHDLSAASLCRGGFFPIDTSGDHAAVIADNRRAIDECVALGAPALVLVCGGIAGGDLPGSRQQVADSIGELAPYAADRGVTLAIEPLHPVYCADRSVISTLGQALAISADHRPDVVGVCVDTFHLWWDDIALATLPTIGERITLYQVCDWLDPLPDVLLGRGMMGDGVIEFHAWTAAVVAAGYTGPIEVEIFNQRVWDTPGDQVLATMRERYESLIAPSL